MEYKPSSHEISMSDFTIKTLTLKNLEQIMEVERSAWDPEWQAIEDKFARRIEVFPEGSIGIFASNGELSGVTTSMLTDIPDIIPDKYKDWSAITGDGYITPHKPDGKSLYVVSVAVSAKFQGQGLGRQLVDAQIDLAKKMKVEKVVLGSRLPGFKEYLGVKGIVVEKNDLEVEADKYLNLKREDGKPFDAEIRFYESYCGFTPEKLLPNFGPDEPSKNFGILMVKRV